MGVTVRQPRHMKRPLAMEEDVLVVAKDEDVDDEEKE